MSRNLAASIRARLKQRADATKQDFNLILTHYGLERLLYRLSISPYAGNYLLKGALLFSLWYDQPHRPTRDADLLGFGPDDIDTAVAAFREMCSMEVDDGIVFDVASIKGSVIRKDAGYGGVRIDLQAKLDGARITLQVDIGFGDAVTPAPESVSYPVLLDDLPAPQLRSYPKYTVVAEKFHAVCLLGMANTRMKDYFDLWVLLAEGALEPTELHRAVKATFARRQLAVPDTVPTGLSDTFSQDAVKQAQWAAFLKKTVFRPWTWSRWSTCCATRFRSCKSKAEGQVVFLVVPQTSDPGNKKPSEVQSERSKHQVARFVDDREVHVGRTCA